MSREILTGFTVVRVPIQWGVVLRQLKIQRNMLMGGTS